MRRKAQALLREMREPTTINGAVIYEGATRWHAIRELRGNALARVLDLQVGQGTIDIRDLHLLGTWEREANGRHSPDEAMIAQWAKRTLLDLCNINHHETNRKETR